MKLRALLACAVLLGCSTKLDPWPGTYDATTTTNGVDCGGSALTPATRDVAITIDREGDRVFIAGRCTVELVVMSDTYATVRPTTCNAALADGTPATTQITGGSFHLSGDDLQGEYYAMVTTSSACVDGTTTVTGTRR